MKNQHAVVHSTPSTETHSLTRYAIGFALSIALTILPFLMITQSFLTGGTAVAALVCFAVAQLIVQVVFFLHLGFKKDARWNLIVFLFSLLVVIIIVVGSLWIMYHLNYNMMPPEAVDEHMSREAQKGF